MGTPEFAVESLKRLHENGYRVVGVITTPDKPAGRGQKLSESAVKQYAVQAGLPLLQPEKLKNPLFLEQLEKLKPDLQVVVAFRMLPEAVWQLPPLGTFNLHASLLPQYRGAAPLHWPIINGENRTGITTFLLDQEIDTGKIMFREEVPIGPDETAGELHDRLMARGAGLVIKTVEAIAAGTVLPVDQEIMMKENRELKPAPKLLRENTRINWSLSSVKIRNLIRGLSPHPAAWTILRNKQNDRVTEMKLFFADCEPSLHGEKPGTLRSDGKSFLKVACADGWLKVTDLQMAGRKRMKTGEFLRGFQDTEMYSAE